MYHFFERKRTLWIRNLNSLDASIHRQKAEANRCEYVCVQAKRVVARAQQKRDEVRQTMHTHDTHHHRCARGD